MKKREIEVVGSYTKQEHTVDAGHYYLIPKHKLAIPYGESSLFTILSELAKLSDFELPNDIDYYPSVSSKHLRTHFSEYTIIPILKEIIVFKPIVCFSGWEQGIRERQARIRAEQEIEARRLAKLADNPFV